MQIGGILISDGGPHPPDKWAAMTAQRIIEDIAPNIVLVDDATHEVAKSSHPKVAEFRKALGKYEAWLRDETEKLHEDFQGRVRAGESHQVTHGLVGAIAGHLIDGAKQFHVGLHTHLSADGAKAAMMERLRLDFGSIIDIEHQYRADGFTVDENHVARKAG